MNKMKEVAKALRVNLKEKFKIKDRNGIYWITEEGLFENSTWLTTNEDTEKLLVELLKGEYEIIREPLAPEEGQEIWLYDPFRASINSVYFSHSNLCHKILENKQLIFRTREEVDEYVEHMRNIISKERERQQ